MAQSRVISISLIASDRMSRAFERATESTDRLARHVERLDAVSRKVSFATGIAGAAAFAKAAAPMAAALTALPAAMAASKAATATLKVGLTGVGDAMSAVAEGDAKALEESLKGLAPNARAFVKETASLKKEWDGVQQSVQDRLFDGLAGDLKPLAGTLLPAVKSGMGGVAGSLNGFAREGARVASSKWFAGGVERVFKGTATSARILTGAIEPTARIVVKLAAAGMPLVQRLAGWAVEGARAGAAFLTSERGARLLESAVRTAGDRLGQLGTVGRNVVVTLANIVRAAGSFNATGTDVLVTLTALTGRMAAWTGSAAGQEKLGQTFAMFGEVAQQVAVILPIFAGALGIVARILISLPDPVRGAVTQMAAWAVVIALITTRLKLLAVATAVFKGGQAVTQFAIGLMSVSRGAAQGASAAARLGATVRVNVALMRSLVAAQLASARASIVATAATVRQAVAQRAAAVGTRLWAAATWLLNIAMRANPVMLIITGIMLLVGAVVLAWNKFDWFRNGLIAIWSALRTGVSAAIAFVRNHWRLILPIILGPLGILIGLVTKYWSQIRAAVGAGVSFAINLVRTRWRLLIAIVLGPLGVIIGLVTKHWGAIKQKTTDMLQGVRSRLTSGFQSAKRIVSDAISATVGIFTSGYTKAKQKTTDFMTSVRDRIRTGLSLVKSAFSTGVTAIGTVWNRLKDITKKPVSFFVNTVYSGGIRKVWSGVRRLVPALPDLPAARFASGGVVPGYAPGRDTVMAMLSPGEGILRPEAVKALGQNWIHGVNHSAKRGGVDAVTRLVAGVGDPSGFPRFADGGIVGILKKPGNWIKNAGGAIMSKGVDWFAKSVLNPILARIPGGTSLWERALGMLPRTLIGKFLEWIKNTVAPNMTGGGSQAAVQAARSQIGIPYSWGGGGLGGPSYGFAQGAGIRGFDCSSLMQYAWGKASGGKDITRTTYSQRGFLRTIPRPVPGAVGQPHSGHTYMYAGNGKIVEAQRTGTRISEHALYRSTPWWGLPPWVMDNGGALPPNSLSLIRNASNRSEMVLNGRQQDLLRRGSGATYQIDVRVAPGGNPADVGREVVSAIQEYERRNGSGWRRR